MKADPIPTALAALDEIPLRTPEGRRQFAKSLASKSNLVVAKAARIIGDAQWDDLAGDLAVAFERFLKRGAELDKGCAALTAIARALFALDYGDAGLFLNGMKHVQMEPVWGGSSDTAAELRAVCAMGLANTTYRDKLRELVWLLVDREWQARAGAVRAIATVGSEAAMLLLRFKALSSDKEPEVLSDCFGSLLATEGADAVPLVTSFADSRDHPAREVAILALGACRRADTIDWLTQRFTDVADVETRQCILLSLATSRTEAAIEFLLSLIREGSDRTSSMAVSAMEVNRADPRIHEEVDKALRARAIPR
jgi:hypothetical protein